MVALVKSRNELDDVAKKVRCNEAIGEALPIFGLYIVLHDFQSADGLCRQAAISGPREGAVPDAELIPSEGDGGSVEPAGQSDIQKAESQNRQDALRIAGGQQVIPPDRQGDRRTDHEKNQPLRCRGMPAKTDDFSVRPDADEDSFWG